MHRRALQAALAELPAGCPPRLAFLHRAPGDPGAGGDTLLCLSASFNPITLAHLALVRAAATLVPPGEVLLLLSLANVDKEMTGLSLERRAEILLAVAARRPAFSVALASHGRFVEKLAAIRACYPAAASPVFLLGADTLIRLFDPRYYTDRAAALERLFAGSRVIAATRAPHGPEALAAFLARPDVAPYAARIAAVELPAHLARISATDVRARLARGDSVAHLVPPEALPLLGG